MEIMSGLTDDQMAIVMCVGAVLGCGLMMSLGFYLGADSRENQEIRILTDQSPLVDQSEESKRKAA